MATPGQHEYTIGALYGIDELASLYQRLSLPHATYTLTTADGLILSRIDTAGKRSVKPTSIAQLASFPRLAAVTAKEPVILEGFSTLTADFNVASVIRIADDVPLLISVAIPRDEVLAPWKRSTRNIIAATAATTLLLLIGIALLYRFVVMLSQREIQLLRLLEGSQASIMIVRNGKVRYANKATDMIFRVPPGTSIVGMSPWEFSPPAQPSGENSEAAAKRLLSGAKQESSTSPWMYRRLDTGESFEAEVSLSSLAFGPHDYQLAIVNDVSGRVRAQRELQRLNETLESRVQERTAELEETNTRLAAANAELEEFTASASHDLRSPLGTISKQCAMIENSLQTDSRRPEVTQRFEKVQSGVRRASEVIDGLLSLARISRQDLQKAPVSLSSVARQVIDELRESEPARHYEFTCAENACVEADPRLMKSLLGNLLSNAWKYSSGRDPARIEFGVDATQQEEVFFVRDNGAGFNMAYSKNLFQAFARLHSADRFAGTGIGLATAARIVKRYGGWISAKGIEDEGATFFFTLPLAVPTARRRAGSASRA
jgi:PAS domain S-box-containing protein